MILLKAKRRMYCARNNVVVNQTMNVDSVFALFKVEYNCIYQ